MKVFICMDDEDCIEKLSENPTIFKQKNWESLAISGQDGIIATVSILDIILSRRKLGGM